MSLMLLGGFFCVIIVGLIILTGYSQAREYQENLLKDQAIKLHSKIRYYENLLSLIPAKYLPKDIHVLICGEIVHTCQSVLEIHAEDSKAKQIKNDYSKLTQNMINGDYKNNGKSAQSITEMGQIQKNLHKVNNFLVRLKLKGTINSEQLNRLNQLLQVQYILVEIDGTLAEANSMKAQGKVVFALSHCQRALALLTQNNNNNVYDEHIDFVKKCIEEIKQETINQESPAQNLNKQWGEFFEEEDAWKKKDRF